MASEPEPRDASEAPASPSADLVVVSDLHLGRGKNRDTGRHFELEAFFYDQDFLGFCTWLCDRSQADARPFKLIFNGDTFDLLRILPEDPEPDATMIVRRFGPAPTPESTGDLMEEILAGHPVFVEALARVVAAGNEIVILPGNHDVEVQWPQVRSRIREAVLDRLEQKGAPAEVVTSASRRLHFPPWFYYEPGRVWVEHGCQYDAECAFEYPLRAGTADASHEVHAAEFDLPLGSFVQRYLFNGFGSITFIVPTTRAHLRYGRFLLLNQPQVLARAIMSHVRFWPQVIRRLVRNADKARTIHAQSHEAALEELAESSGLGDTLKEIDGMKASGGGAVEAVSTLVRQAMLGLTQILLIAGAGVGLWFAGFHTIADLRAGFPLKALLFLILDFGFLFALIAFVGYFLFRSPKESSHPLRRAANRLATLVDVPIVTFGHTHTEVVWRLARRPEQRAFYYNTGTWLAVFTHDELVPRERVQFTFLRVRDTEAELLYWSPGRGRPMPVILLDEEDDEGEPRRAGEAAPV